jgi:hypothetical membrane protein
VDRRAAQEPARRNGRRLASRLAVDVTPCARSRQQLGTASFPYAGSVIRIGAVLWIVATLAYFLAEAIAAAALPEYSYAADYISVLGQPDVSPHANSMNAAFVAQGVLFPLGAILLMHGARAPKKLLFLCFGVLNGIGNILVATVHSGAGARWHIVGAALAIVGGNAAVLAGSSALRSVISSRTHRVASVVLGTLGLLALIGAAFELPAVGDWERASVYSIFIWQAYTALYLLGRPSKRYAS